MNIVVLLKAVPVVGTERLDDDLLTDRSVQLEANGNDEYLLEKALKLTETHGGEVIAADRRAGRCDRGACARRWRWARRAPSTSSTTRIAWFRHARHGRRPRRSARQDAAVRPGLRRARTHPTGRAAWSAQRWPSRLGLPYLSYASEIEPTDGGVRIHRISPAGYDVLEAPTPAVVMGTQLLGRRATRRCAASCRRARSRSRPGRWPTWASMPRSVGAGAATTTTLDAAKPPERAGATFVREAPDDAVAQIVEFLAGRRLI